MSEERTRARAIEILENRKAHYYGLMPEWVWDMAIKALDQEPILDKIKAEIETEYGQCYMCEYFEDYDYEENNISEYIPMGNIADILQIIDKYKAESEDKE